MCQSGRPLVKVDGLWQKCRRFQNQKVGGLKRSDSNFIALESKKFEFWNLEYAIGIFIENELENAQENYAKTCLTALNFNAHFYSLVITYDSQDR